MIHVVRPANGTLCLIRVELVFVATMMDRLTLLVKSIILNVLLDKMENVL